MKLRLVTGWMLLSALLAGTIVACGSRQTAQPAIDVDATIAAQVQATLAASQPTPPATATPAPAVDVDATVQAVVQMTLQAQPTQTPTAVNTPTDAPSATPVPTPTATHTPASPPASAASGLPSGRWLVRSYNTDDIGVIWVNGQLVGASTYRNDTDWININDYLLPIDKNIVAFASYNGSSGGSWGFGLRRDDVSVWGVEQSTPNSWSLSYAQQVAILADGTIEVLKPDTSARRPPPGKWYVRAQYTQDVGSILVNGQPVAAFVNQAADWTEITGLLNSTSDNIITFAAWNFGGPYSWDFAIKQDDTIVWGKQNTGSGAPNQVFNEVVTISSAGQIVQAQPVGRATDYTWALRSYNTDDVGVMWLNEELIGTSIYRNDSDWADITARLLPAQANIVAFASFNGSSAGSWGFGVRRDDVTVWGVEQSTRNSWSLAYAQQVVIGPDGSVEAARPDTSARTPPPGKWYVRAQNIQDIGSILVNGHPIAAIWNQAADWTEITSLLDSTRDNSIVFAAWNTDGPYAWDFAIKRDEDIPWAISSSGSGQTGVVLQQKVTITGDGRVVQTTP